MIVANSTPTSNPKLTDQAKTAKTAREAIEAIDTVTAEIKQVLMEAVATSASFDNTERMVRELVLRIGYQAMSTFVALQGDGDLGKSLVTDDGKTLHRSESPSRTTIRSIFGDHRFEQFTYSAGKHKSIKLRPISARMELPERRWSYLVQELVEMLAVDQAYEQATSNLGQILGGKFSVDTAEQINGQMGQDAGEFLGNLPVPEPGSEAKFLVATADCKGVPLVKEDAPKVAAFETAKKNPGNRRMATVASVYTVDPHVRTAEDVTEALFRDEIPEDEPKTKRPKPQNKNTTAHFPEVEEDGVGGTLAISGIHVAMAWLIGQVVARRRPGQVLLVLMDGQESLWETLKLHLSFSARTVPILDILHALSYIWKAAKLFTKTDAARRAFTRQRLLRILRGEVRGVIRGLRRMGTIQDFSGESLKELTRICGYLEKNADRMRYDEYLRRGYPIASGVIEGACRHLVKDRMERSGMRWTLEGARSMLHVRSAFQSDHWRTFLDHRIHQEVTRIHRHRKLIGNYQHITLAC
jgi:hypothetical protein